MECFEKALWLLGNKKLEKLNWIIIIIAKGLEHSLQNLHNFNTSSYHFALLASQNDDAVALLQPGLVAGGQIVQATVNILAHCHDVIKVFLCCHCKLQTGLRRGLGELRAGEAIFNLHPWSWRHSQSWNKIYNEII